jgi:hypothetical protein
MEHAPIKHRVYEVFVHECKVYLFSVFLGTKASEHSTSLELLNGNVTLAHAMDRWRGTTIVEIFDNQAASCSARRLACHSDSLNKHMAYRRTLLAKYSHSARVFSIWAQRELGTLADMLSKNEIDQFWLALAERGFPKPEQQMFPRPGWYI